MTGDIKVHQKVHVCCIIQYMLRLPVELTRNCSCVGSVVTFLSSAYNVQTLQNNSVFPDLQSDEVDTLYSAYGDDTGVQCALRYEEALFFIVKFVFELGCSGSF